MIRSGHIQWNAKGFLLHLQRMKSAGEKQVWVVEGNTPVEWDTAIEYVQKMIDDGYTNIPCSCPESQKAPGECVGWKK